MSAAIQNFIHVKITVMKNLLFALAGFLLTANLFAQSVLEADTVFHFWWDLDSNAWKSTYRSFNTYNGECHPKSSTTQTRISGLWIKDSKIFYTYDVNGHIRIENYKSRDTVNGSFENYYKLTYTYNASGNITFISGERWDGSAWQDDQRDNYNYDASGYLTSILTEQLVSGSWVNLYLHKKY